MLIYDNNNNKNKILLLFCFLTRLLYSIHRDDTDVSGYEKAVCHLYMTYPYSKLGLYWIDWGLQVIYNIKQYYDNIRRRFLQIAEDNNVNKRESSYNTGQQGTTYFLRKYASGSTLKRKMGNCNSSSRQTLTAKMSHIPFERDNNGNTSQELEFQRDDDLRLLRIHNDHFFYMKNLRTKKKGNVLINMEIRILQSINHPNLVQIYGVCTDNHPFLMITELLDHGDLLNLLRSDEEHSLFDFDDLLRISLDITNGMCAVSKKGIVHRDIAARNILIDKWYRAKVGDFGMSCDTDYVGVGGTDRVLPIKWTAPECVKRRIFTTKSDVWSFGIVLWETFSYGESPYATIEPSKIIKKVNIGYRLDIPKMPMSSNDREEDQRHKEKIYKIMLLCWCKLPEERPSFIELRQLLKDFKNVSDEKLNYDYADYERRNGYQKNKKTKKKHRFT
ncbi:Tyrosine-protein kinase Fer [Lepeophtheirus salmonis]|uniref:Tyrosine-protein kinase Fer n=1 Tax=Lepeophtheirus salmonis TaxID=72036 RepID=A0A7R8CJZ3_LEPSM|nr:Tyrosine-protein kinase Fer [Lepeophtheirus salmonis]CAF2810653.1 Tyrosine-protein kinase Fer [Lepeophtheirus salmonis]